MKLHELRAVPGAKKAPKRKGRGTATGQGKTAGRGMNGQNSRSGGGTRPGFEGGQMPLYRRIPKRGFTNIWRTEYSILNVDDLNRFEAGAVVTPDMLKEAVDFVRMNSRTKSVIGDDGLRHDKEEYPIVAIREAILNALVHRDYSVHTENVPIRLEMYRDRLEITNSGGLYGKITIDSLGKVRPETRNAALANMLELLKVTENRYSGIPTIRRVCKDAGLPAPIFSVLHGEFKVVFRNNIYKTETGLEKEDLEDALLRFCDEPRTRAELVDFTGLSRYYTMSNLVQPLVAQGKLRMTIPDKPKSPKQRFVRVK